MKTGRLQQMVNKSVRRKILGGGIAALAVVGLSSVAQTSAALTVQNSVEGYAGSAVELLPPPADVKCRNTGGNLSAFSSAQYYWPSMGPEYRYEISYGGSRTGTEYQSAVPAGQTIEYNMGEWLVGKVTNGNFTITIRAINELGEVSDRAFHANWKSSTFQNFRCNGGEAYDPLTEDPVAPPNLDPQDFSLVAQGGVWDNLQLREANLLAQESDVADEDADASGRETPPTSAEPTPTESSTTESAESQEPTTSTTEPSTTPPASTTTPPITSTTEPATTTESSSAILKPTLTGPVASPSGQVTAGRTGDGEMVAVVDESGKFLAGGDVDPDATLHWQKNADVLWIIGSDQVHRIMKSSDGTWKFYVDSGQNMPTFN